MFSVVSVGQSFCAQGRGSRVTITHDVLDLTTQVTSWPQLPPPDMGPHCTGMPSPGLGPIPLDIFKLVHYEVCIVDKRVVHILLECFLVSVMSPPRELRKKGYNFWRHVQFLWRHLFILPSSVC